MPTHTLIALSGALSEDSQMPAVSVKLPIHINFKNVVRLNSRGIKLWCQWIGQFKAPARLHFEECPAIVVKSFNLVKGCIPDTAQVDSFFVPLYSSPTGERKDVLVVRGRDFDGKDVRVPEQKDSKGNPMEVDVHETYWSFLRK